LKVLAANPGHDGSVAWIEDGVLRFSLEAEKDSNPRHAALGVDLVFEALEQAGTRPDVVALGGWGRSVDGRRLPIGAGYSAADAVVTRPSSLLGTRVRRFSSSHKRSHVMGALGMSPFETDSCAVLVWEGSIGSLFRWDRRRRSLVEQRVMAEPGARYASLFALADPAFPDSGSLYRPADAGKLMALAGLADREREIERSIRSTVDALLGAPTVYPFDKAAFADSPLYNVGVEDPGLHVAAAHLTDRIFDVFHAAALRWLPPGLPLAIGGGCGLNCDWNTRWAVTGHFSDISVGPTVNDSGSAIGTGIDALIYEGEHPNIDWDVYRGAPLVADEAVDADDWEAVRVDYDALAKALAHGAVVAWVDGRAELGPRALGNRSLLASAHRRQSHDRLNAIKRREPYRPIAPCCLDEEHERWFEGPRRDPHMLFFSRVKTDRLPAVTHSDGTARVQTVRADGPRTLRRLLQATARVEGAGVLCNTSLNFPGRGAINRTSDLVRFCGTRGVDGFVIGDRWYRRRDASVARG
jgi:hydroxymethyl cephem carbamoyltransferase